MKNLNDLVRNCSALKTRAGAQKRLDAVASAVSHSTGFIFQREDGMFIPVVIMDHRDMSYAMLVATDGVFVIN